MINLTKVQKEGKEKYVASDANIKQNKIARKS